uniref:Major facilitator superfamily (MFS) profile domain-containing protein n=1 Tax=Acrobeloides nanus TaxID=290746 RepID=A0A914EJ51_9BILA
MKSKEPPHKPELGGFIYWLCAVAVVGGFIFGFDTSILSPAFIYLQNNEEMKPWSDGWKDALFSFNLGMAALGALFAGIIADIYGRKKAIMLGDIINTIGAIICCAAFTKWILLIGVIFLGLATGMSSHTVPLYIKLRAAHERSEKNKARHNGARVMFRIFLTPHVRKALFVGCALQIFQQASGANTILYFTDTLFKSSGITGDHDSIFLSVGPAGI